MTKETCKLHETRYRRAKYGTLEAIWDNIRDALQNKHHSQLKKRIIGYKEVTTRDYFKHLNATWYKFETGVIKQRKASFYESWKLVDHIVDFGLKLTEKQEYLTDPKFKILDNTKLYHYIN